MKEYSPGASMNDDYAYTCDCCGGHTAPTLIWKELSQNRDHFVLCFKCLGNLYAKHIQGYDKSTETIAVSRMVIKEEVRNKIFERDGNKCKNCGSETDLCIDHIIPFSRGGTTNQKNLQILCRTCNIKKRDNI